MADRGGDPPSSFIRRFAGQGRTVEPASSAAPTDDLTVTHKSHSGRGVIYKIKNIQWLDRDTAEVTGGRYAGQTNASDSKYRVERQGGSWNVVQDKRLWVSLGGQ